MWDLNQTNSYLPVVQREATSPRGPRYHGGPSEELGPPHDTSRTTPCQSFWWSGKGWKLYQVACGSPAIWGSCWECSSPPLSSTSLRSKNQVFCKEEKHLKMSRRETVFLWIAHSLEVLRGIEDYFLILCDRFVDLPEDSLWHGNIFCFHLWVGLLQRTI